MPYNIYFENRVSHLYFKLTGPESYESAIQFWESLLGVCSREGKNNVLIVDEVEGRLSTIELHKIGEIVAQLFTGKRIAFVDTKDVTYEDNKFGETVILNRGGELVKLFNHEEEALNWLVKPSP